MDFQKRIGPLIREALRDPELGQRILELGTGLGNTTELILQAAPQARIVTVDVLRSMLHYAHKALRAHEERVTFYEGTGLKYLRERGGKRFSLFVEGGTLHNFPRAHRQVHYRELLPALEPGAGVIFTDKIVPDDDGLAAALIDQEVSATCAQLEEWGYTELARDWRAHYERDNLPAYVMREGETIADLRNAGFELARIRSRHLTCATLTARRPLDTRTSPF